MITNGYFLQRKTSLIIVLVLIILGSIVYFTYSVDQASAMDAQKTVTADLDFLKDIRLKAAYTAEGTIDIFALAKNNALAKLSPSKGNPIPEEGGMVLGSVEGSMMLEEGEFQDIGDSLIESGLTFRIDGLLEPTGTFADDFHFVTNKQFVQLEGDPDVLLVVFKDANTPKLFYLYDPKDPSPATIALAEGNMNLFYKHVIDNNVYHPIIIGAKEAEMMREEKLFTNVGDTIKGFFGRDVMIAGITAETDTGLDMMHLVEKGFFASNLNKKNDRVGETGEQP